MSGDPSVGEVRQASISGNVENKADAFGLVEWFAHELTNAHETMTPTDYRIDVTVEFRDRVAIKRALQRHGEPVDLEDIGVSVLTIHASKGQEAEDVVVYDGISRRIRREMEASERAYNNEWRTWYVALSRASERLHIMRDGFQWTSPIIPQNIRDIAAGGDGGATA